MQNKLTIGEKVYQLPSAWEELSSAQLQLLFDSEGADLFSLKLHLLQTIVPNAQLLRWKKDAKKDFFPELVAVLQAATSFLFVPIENQNQYQIAPMLTPPRGFTALGTHFQDATFDQFATIDKAIQKKDFSKILKNLNANTKKKWLRKALVHHAVSCHQFVIQNLPASMRSSNAQPDRFGWAAVQMELAGEKLGNYQQVKNANIWDVIVLFDNIDKKNQLLKKRK